MIISEIFALLIGQVAQYFERTQVVRELAGCNDRIEDVDGCVDGKNGSYFANDHVDVTLNLEMMEIKFHKLQSIDARLTSLPCLYESMILRRINSRKFVQHGRIEGLQIIFESVWRAAIMTTWFCDSIIFSSVIMICLTIETN